MTDDPDRRIQRTVETVWRDVLRIDEIDVDDNFFELGGTSSDAVLVACRLGDELGIDVLEIGLFERPTVSATTELLATTAGAGPGRDILDSRLRGVQRRAAYGVPTQREVHG